MVTLWRRMRRRRRGGGAVSAKFNEIVFYSVITVHKVHPVGVCK
jgi:hypothetical protein